MTVFRVWGKEKKPIERSAIDADLSLYSNCIIDVGAGDAKGSWRYAKAHPDTFVISLDSSFNAQDKTSRVAAKKPEKGGAKNLLCLYGNVKDAEVLKDVANEIRVILPWGDLLEGIAEISNEIVGSLSDICKEEGKIIYIINAEIWEENLPKHLEHLGRITPEFFIDNKTMFEKFGQQIVESHDMELDEIRDLDTTWSAKLMSSRTIANFVKATVVVKKMNH